MNKLYEIVLIARVGRKRVRALASKGLYIAVCRGLTFTWFAFTLAWLWSDWSQLSGLAASLCGSAVVAALLLVLVVATIGLWEAMRVVLQAPEIVYKTF